MGKFFMEDYMVWESPQRLEPHKYTCAYCGALVSSEKGYKFGLGIGDNVREANGGVYICPSCNHPTIISKHPAMQIPGVSPVPPLHHLPDNIKEIYNEARTCISQECYTSTAMICRKIIMHVAVDKGADPDKNFAYYVNYIKSNHYVPPNSDSWIDPIREKGNEANHEIEPISASTAKGILTFTHYMLLFIYEMPNATLIK